MTTEPYPAQLRREIFMRNGNEIPRRVCETCGQRFFTGVGLDEHVRLGQHSTDNVIRSWVTGRFSPAGLAAMRQAGRAVAAANNSRRRRCDACGHVSTPGGISQHQRGSGHVGWSEVSP